MGRIILISILFSMNFFRLGAQAVADTLEIPLRTVVTASFPISTAAKTILNDRLTQAVVLNGMASVERDRERCKYILLATVNLLSEEVYPSIPPKNIVEVEVSFYVADNVNKIIHQQTSLIIKKVSASKEKAVLEAIKSIDARNPRLKKLIVNGKDKIIEFNKRQVRKPVESELSGSSDEYSWILK